MDLAALSTALTTQINSAITAGFGPAAVVLGAVIGYRIYKHFVKG